MARATRRATSGRRSTGRVSQADVVKAQRKVLGWFDEHAREFPWRRSRDPYATLVAEFMLQQTQTGRVGPSYEAFLKRFPTLQALAHAPAMDVIDAWKGLGYNRRAVHLQRAAQAIEREHLGIVPDDPDVLAKLPGVGAYSAAAVACFAHDVQVPVVDVNVTRVLARAALGRQPEDVDPASVSGVASSWLPDGEAYRWNQALMDIGAMLCRNEKPLCAQCPLKSVCRFHAAGRHKEPRAARPAKEPFAGSRRQKRGGIVDALRAAAGEGITLRALADAIHPDTEDRDLSWLVELLEGLERDGLITMSPSARRGSARGVVRLPR